MYFSPLDSANKLELTKIWEALTSNDPSDAPTESRELTIWGRKLRVPLSTSKASSWTFEELCGRPRSAADYIEICKNFGTIFVEDVPRMGIHQRDLVSCPS